MSIYLYEYICIYIYIYIYIYTHTYNHTHTHTPIHTKIHTHTNTNTHTHTQTQYEWVMVNIRISEYLVRYIAWYVSGQDSYTINHQVWAENHVHWIYEEIRDEFINNYELEYTDYCGKQTKKNGSAKIRLKMKLVI